jgi:hypothetical protein
VSSCFYFDFKQENVMRLQRKLIIVALASAMPWVSAQAQSAADLQKEIAALKAQLQSLQQRVEAISAKSEAAVSPQQVSRIELKQDQTEADFEKSGLKGLNFKGTIEAAYLTDSLSNIHTFGARDGNGGTAMLELTKETPGGEGINWTLRLTPGYGTSNLHEASISAPIGEASGGNRLIGGLLPDFQGYEGAFANQNPLVTHNALYDFTGATSYTGLGMSHQLFNAGGQTVALKWIVGNIDSGSDTVKNTNNDIIRSTGLAYRVDWTLSEYATLGFSGARANSSRNFSVIAVDGGYLRGDWTLNGHLNVGSLEKGAANTDANGAKMDAAWWGVSALVGYKITPRLQLLARADYINDEKNGGGIYTNNCFGGSCTWGSGAGASGFGPTSDPLVGANLTRLSLGTNYLLNPSTQWKTEVRLDQSTGANFADSNGNPNTNKTTFGTSVVVAF